MLQILKSKDRIKTRAIFKFNSNTPSDEVIFRFNLWTRHFYPKFFAFDDAPFHNEIDRGNLDVYRGTIKFFTDIAFRGAAKTTRTKLFVAFCIANDANMSRKYIKVLSADQGNAVQIVTDVYNLLIRKRVLQYYPEIFQKTTEKRPERMSVFTTSSGIKMQADSVGVDQRGDIQEEARPDFVWFDDFETRKTLRSAVETQKIWDNMEEAKDGLAKSGAALYNCNYVSERGNVHRLVMKKALNRRMINTPIREDGEPTWPQAYTKEEIQTIEDNAEDFEGEYLGQPSAGADVFFDRDTLNKQEKKEPIRTIAGFKIFHKYTPGHRIGCGADVAGGVGLDSSTSVFIDFTTTPSRVVATFANNTIDPMVFGDELMSQGDHFGQCIIAVENNKYDQTIARLRHLEYNNLYFRDVKSTRSGMPPKTREYGYNTNMHTKNKILSNLKAAVANGHLELSDENLINELKSYSRDDLMENEVDPRLTTRHFDLLMACAIAYETRHQSEVSEESNESYQQPDYESPGLDM